MLDTEKAMTKLAYSISDIRKSVAKELAEYLEYISKQIWSDFNPKVANSISSDYAEYYDVIRHLKYALVSLFPVENIERSKQKTWVK